MKKVSVDLFGLHYNLELPWSHWEDNVKLVSGKEVDVHVRYTKKELALVKLSNLNNLLGINRMKNITCWKQDDGYLFLTKGFGSLKVGRNNHVTLHIDQNGAEWEKIPFLLFYSVALPVVLRSFDYLVLHGNVLAYEDHCIALIGDSGHGKSTFTAFLMQIFNWNLVSDDLTVLKPIENNFHAYPGAPYIKIKKSESVFRMLGLDESSMESVSSENIKYFLPCDNNYSSFSEEKKKLTHIFMLLPDNSVEKIEISELTVKESISVLSLNIHNMWSIDQSAIATQMQSIFKLLSSNTKVYMVKYRQEYETILLNCTTLHEFIISNRI